MEALISGNPGLANESVSVGRKEWTRPLHRAAWKGNAGIATLLLDKGAEVNATIGPGETALHIAASAGKVPVVALLLKRGATVDAPDTHGYTPMHRVSNDEAAQLLVSAGADASARNKMGETPLHNAARYATIGRAVTLCAAGADVTARDNEGFTPGDRASETSVAMTPWMREVCPRLRALHARNEVVSDDARMAATSEYHCYELQAETPDPRRLTSRAFQARACSALASALERAQGVEKDVARAVNLYKLACDNGDAPGCTNLGSAYESGKSVARDEVKARGLYQKACAEKDAWACDRLGRLKAPR